MIISLNGVGVVDHKDESKVMDILNKLQMDTKKYIVDIGYSSEGTDERTSIGYIFKDDDGKSVYTCETLNG